MEYYGTSSNSQPTTPYLTHGPHETVQSFFTTDTDPEPPDKWLEEDEVSEEELPKPPLPSPPPSCANTSCLAAAFAARRGQLFKAAYMDICEWKGRGTVLECVGDERAGGVI